MNSQESLAPPVDTAQAIEIVSEVMPIVACMGSSACQRVCEFINDEPYSPESFGDDATGVLPFEKDCSILGDIGRSEVNVELVRDLIDATKLPTFERLTSQQVEAEITGYLEHLIGEQIAFDEHLGSMIAGRSVPKSVQTEKQARFEEAKVYESAVQAEYATDEDKQEFAILRTLARGFYDLNTLENKGVMFDDAMRATLLEAATRIGAGRNISFSGEPGIAKTTLAKHLARINAATRRGIDHDDPKADPILVEFSSTTEAESIVSEQTFEDNTLGKELAEIGKAMKDGRGVVLDEYNALPADQAVRLNNLLLQKPGQIVTIAGKEITIAPGYSVIATMNPLTDKQGNRRQGRNQQDSANAARFSRIDMKYPGETGFEGNGRETVNRLFHAAWAQDYGWEVPSSDHLKLAEDTTSLVLDLARMATSPPTDGTSASLSNTRNAVPILAECITPRDLFMEYLNVEFSSNHSDKVGVGLRASLRNKVMQMLSSDNGHIISPENRSSVMAVLNKYMR